MGPRSLLRYVIIFTKLNLTNIIQGSGDDDLHLNQLTRDELLGWIEGHNVEAPGKRAQKKGT